MSQARVLAIDDQPYFRRLVEELLGARGYAVTTAASAQEALEALESSGGFDLVVTDLMLSDADGIETVRRLRERWPAQRVVVLSSISDVRAAVAAMHAGAVDYLLKPVDREGLPAALERALARPADRPAAPAAGDAEHTRLIEEHSAALRQVSLLDRTAALLTTSSRDAFERDLLALLCAEAGASEGLLWVATGATGAYRLAAVSGDLPDDGTAPQVPDVDAATERELCTGRVVTRSGSEGGAEMLVPCATGDGLLAVARLLAAAGAGFAPGGETACGRVAGLAAVGLERLARPVAGADGTAPEPIRDPRTGLPGRSFLEEVAAIELQKAQRFGRRVCLVCVELGEVAAGSEARALEAAVGALHRTMRGTDVVASEGTRRFWVMVTDADPLGGVVLKRRLGQRVRQALREAGVFIPVSLGAAGYPIDGERFDALREEGLRQVREERRSIAHELGIDAETPLAEIGQRLLEQAVWVPPHFVAEAAELLVGELSCRPRDRGLLFLAPGDQTRAVMDPLTALGDTETATDVFVATDGETMPSGTAVTALGLPPDVAPETTWMVRFGEAPAYALIAGTARRNGDRPVFHSSDPVLIEHVTFRLRAEIGFGVRG